MSWAAVGSIAVGAIGASLAPSSGGNSSARDEALRRQGQIAGKVADIGSQRWDNYQKNFMPLESQVAGLASVAGSQEQQDAMAGKATADVTQQFGNAEEQLARTQSRNGVVQNSGNATAQQADMALAQAKTTAGAATKARQDEYDRGFLMKRDALNTGKSLDGTRELINAGAGLSSVVGGNQKVIDSNTDIGRRNADAFGTLVGAGADAFRSNNGNNGNNSNNNIIQPTVH